MADSSLVSFYRGSGQDHAGRRLDEILAWDDGRLEQVHDYVQWLFPNADPSRANPFAPLLTAADRAAFASDPTLAANLRRSFLRMLAFYGFDRNEDAEGVSIRPSPAWRSQLPHWLQPSHHNHLRLTRIMKCLHALGNDSDARALQAALLDIAERTHPKLVTRSTVRYWKTALE